MKKKFIMILAIIWFCISFLIISSTFAKYLTSIGSNTNVSIATWKISINNQDVINSNDFSSVVSLTFPETQYYLGNCIVPTATGYFELVLDSSELVMPFSYTISCAPSLQNDITDIKITGYSLDQGTTITSLTSGQTSITNNVAANVSSTTIWVYVQWDDTAATENLNDIADTDIAINSGKASIVATVDLNQL